MPLNFTPQQIKEMAEMWASDLFTPEERITVVSTMPLEERLAGENPAEVINLFKQTHQLNPMEILGQFSTEEIEDYLKTLKNH
ncbi:MAG TPA: hypothetical protein EYP59_14890 [Thiotrichaceae bacterium]|nr:hypothetical protein [Thiotrichaceae bacterium]